MPVYEYACAACRHTFSQFFRSVSAATTPVVCPRCGVDAERQLSRFAIVQTEQQRLDHLDPRYTNEVDHAWNTSARNDPVNRLPLDLNFEPKDE